MIFGWKKKPVTKMISYACPGTQEHSPHVFKYLHHPSVSLDPLPRYCGICGYDSNGVELEQPIGAPHIQKSIKGVVDNMHRGMEAGSEFRAQMAQEQFGLSTDEANLMKETNMKDNLREGDTSEAPVNNDVSRMIESAPPGLVGFQGAAAAAEFARSPQLPGVFPRAGMRAQSEVRNMHALNTSGAGHAGTTTSTVPTV